MEWLARVDPGALMVGIAVLGALLSLPFFVLSIRRLRRVKLIRGTLYLLFGGVVLLAVAGAGMVAANLFTYARLTHEQEAARVTTRRLGERQFAVSVQTRTQAPRTA